MDVCTNNDNNDTNNNDTNNDDNNDDDDNNHDKQHISLSLLNDIDLQCFMLLLL